MLLICAASATHWVSAELSGSSLYYAEQLVNLQLEGKLKSYLLYQSVCLLAMIEGIKWISSLSTQSGAPKFMYATKAIPVLMCGLLYPWLAWDLPLWWT
jgi:hypothetical protein